MLAVNPCRTLCHWAPAAPRDWSPVEGQLLRCGGCLSEWVPTERWTPRQADGTVPEAVREALRDA